MIEVYGLVNRNSLRHNSNINAAANLDWGLISNLFFCENAIDLY